MNYLNRSIGSFNTSYDSANRIKSQLNPLGHIINTVIANCVFRPPVEPSETTHELKQLIIENSKLTESFEDIKNVPSFKGSSWSFEKCSLYVRAAHWKVNHTSLQKHQDNFKPIGAIIIAGSFATIILTTMHWLVESFIPKAFKENAKFISKVGVGAAFGTLVSEAVQGWHRFSAYSKS